MHINVRDFLAEEVGYNRAFTISGERPTLEAVNLAEDLEGEITISRLEDSLLVQGDIHTAIQLECHRCLRSFTRPTHIAFAQLYSEHPGDEELPITADQIDLAPLVEQEIIVNLPIKVLCREDCAGIEGAAAEYTADQPGSTLKHQARIKKGSPHARISRPEETNHQ